MDIYEDCFLDVYGRLESMQEVLKLYIKDKMSEAQEKARNAG